MSLQPDRHAYFRSLAAELTTQANRVRFLIGDAHWLSDGHHKEYLLTSLLERHIPGSTLIGRGFVVDPSSPEVRSKEQDIMVIDTTSEAPLFNQGGLLVAQPHTVLATISVKSTMRADTIVDSVQNQASVRHVLRRAGIPPFQTWCGAYFFLVEDAIQNSPQRIYEAYERAISSLVSSLTPTSPAPCGPDLLCASSSLLVTARAVDVEKEGTNIHLLGFAAGELATAVFLALIIDHIARVRSSRSSEFPALVEHPEISPFSPSSHDFAYSTHTPTT